MKEKINRYVQEWEAKCYFNGIPDEIPVRMEQLNKAPSYKQIAKAILDNDYPLESLGFTAKKSKYYHQLKRIELDARNKPIQLKLF